MKQAFKVCSRCRIEQHILNFTVCSKAGDGLSPHCKDCASKAKKLHKLKDPSKAKHQQRAADYKRYGITIAEYETLLQLQKGSCFICKKHHSEFRRRLAIDHDHGTGKIRGLLCNKCNQGIGLLQEDITILRSAIDYLQK